MSGNKHDSEVANSDSSEVVVHALKTVGLSLGSIVWDAGTKVFGTKAALDMLGVNNTALRGFSLAVAATSSSWSLGMTRGLNMWRFTSKGNKKGSIPKIIAGVKQAMSTSTKPINYSFVALTTTGCVAAGASTTVMTKFSSSVLMNAISIHNKYAHAIVGWPLATTAGVTLVSFAAMQAAGNGIFVMKKLANGDSWNAGKLASVFVIAELRMLGTIAVANLIMREALPHVFGPMSNEVLTPLALIMSVLPASICTQNRALKTYKEAVSSASKKVTKAVNAASFSGYDVLQWTNKAMGAFFLLALFTVTTVGYLKLAEQFGMDEVTPLLLIGAGMLALCGVVLEYNFTNKTMFALSEQMFAPKAPLLLANTKPVGSTTGRTDGQLAVVVMDAVTNARGAAAMHAPQN